MRFTNLIIFCVSVLLSCIDSEAKFFPPDSTLYDSVVSFSASKKYKAGKFKKFLFGEHYRQVWKTKVVAPVFDIRSHQMKVVKKGGGRQTVNLRLIDSTGREYVLRSIDKKPDNVLPEDLKETFIADILKDQTSTDHPYGAFTIPPLAEAAGVFHTNPILVYVPKDSTFGEFANVLGNQPALFEERPDGPMEDLDHFGNPVNVIGTEKMLEKRFGNHNNKIDEHLYARSRLFDMWLGDWGRHEDQWRWGEFPMKEDVLYKPIPRDRDHVYFKFDGLLPTLVSRSWAVRHWRHFDCQIKDLKGLNWSARNIDRIILTGLSEQDWVAIADSLEFLLTDSVIELAIKRMPSSVYEVSGEEIISKLKSRRAQLTEVAKEYYKLLAKEVSVYGSDRNEKFEITRLEGSTEVNVYKLDNGDESGELLYTRMFYNRETDEIRVYGLEGSDEFIISGKAKKGITVRVIGGEGMDKFLDRSFVKVGEKKTKYYDSKKFNQVYFYKETRDMRSEEAEDSIHSHYSNFHYNMTTPVFYPEFNVDDGLFLGLGVSRKSYGFRKHPYAKFHRLGVNFSTRTGAFNFGYFGDFRAIIRHWNLGVEIDVFGPKYVINFFGFGNETILQVDDIDFYRARARQIKINPFLYQEINKYTTLGLGPFYESFNLQRTPERFISTTEAGINDEAFENNQFSGLNVFVKISSTDRKIYPSRGLRWNGEARGVQEISGNLRFLNLYSDISFYYSPSVFSKYVTLATRMGVATNVGEFFFFQANRLGGTTNLRGYRRDRFYGRTSFFHNNEVRLKLFRLRTYLTPFKMGLLGFYDYGRVWVDNERSDEWHTGYGPGVWIEIYDRYLFSGTYGFSKEEGFVNVQLGFLF